MFVNPLTHDNNKHNYSNNILVCLATNNWTDKTEGSHASSRHSCFFEQRTWCHIKGLLHIKGQFHLDQSVIHPLVQEITLQTILVCFLKDSGWTTRLNVETEEIFYVIQTYPVISVVKKC